MLRSPLLQQSSDFVAHRLGFGHDVLPQFLHLAAVDLEFLEGLVDVDLGLPLDVGELDLRLRHVDLGPLDPALVAVVDRQRDGDAERPGRGALQPVGTVVLEGIGLPEDDRRR